MGAKYFYKTNYFKLTNIIIKLKMEYIDIKIMILTLTK